MILKKKYCSDVEATKSFKRKDEKFKIKIRRVKKICQSMFAGRCWRHFLQMLAVLDENGEVNVFKSPTTPHDWTEGILGALKVAAEHYNQDFEEFLKDISVENGGLFTLVQLSQLMQLLKRDVVKLELFVLRASEMYFYLEKDQIKTHLICS